jgi:hypothetical protein
MKHSRSVIAIAASGAAVALILVAGPAQAAVPQPPYDNTDPASTGCSAGATTIASYPIKSTVSGAVVGTLEVRYSSSCDTNWVRVNNTMSGTVANKYIDRISTLNPGPPTTGYAFNSQLDSDPGLGSSYGFQLGAASVSCNHVGAWFTDASNVIVATSGQFTLC